VNSRLPFGEACPGIRIGVDEHVPVVERRHQPDVPRQQACRCRNTSPDMSPMPTTVKSSELVSMPSAWKWNLTASQAPRAVMAIFLWS